MTGKSPLGHPFELLSAHVDYATLTCGTGERGVLLYDLGLKLLQVEEDSGNGRKPWRGFQYAGWASRHVTVGRRLDGAIVRLSGDIAHQYWRRFFGVSDRVTRLDLAVTGHTDATSFNVAHLAQREVRAWKRQHDSRLTVGYQFQDPGGATCTIGSRSSEKYARIYDKWAESGPPYSPGDWRWEVEYKGDTAYALASDLYSQKNLSERVGSLTMAFFAERGISIPFAASGGQWRYTPTRAKISVEAKLDYLARSIRPMVAECVYAVGEQTVLDTLGLARDNPTQLLTQLEMRELERESVTR